MNTFLELLQLAGVLAGLLTEEPQTRQSASPEEDTGYTLTVSPSESVADGIGGEEAVVSWQAPLGAITLVDIINFYRLFPDSGSDLIWTKQTLLRFGDSEFTFKEPGSYEVVYKHFSFFEYYTKATALVSVLPTTALISKARNYPPRGNKIIMFGDSLVRDPVTASNLVYWLELQTGFVIENAGKAGDTTADGHLRLESDVLAKKPDIVGVLLIGNDLLQQVSPEVSFANLHKIVERIQTNGAIAIVIGLKGGFTTDRYAEGFHELYTSTKAGFVPDILADIAFNPFLKEDKVHPNAEGYRKMASRISPLLIEAMKGYVPPPPSKLTLTIDKLGNELILSWFAKTNQSYSVLFTETVEKPVALWESVQTIKGAGSVTNVTFQLPIQRGYFALQEK